MSPILAARLYPNFDALIDGGRTLRGRSLPGAHRTWLAVLTLVFVNNIAATTVFWLLGLRPGWI